MDQPGLTAADEELRARVQALHDNVHDALESQFSEAFSDLVQLRSILGDATGKLSQAFGTMVRQAREQERQAKELQQQVGVDAAAGVVKLAGEITSGAMLVVQALQFEDMANQLLQHVDKKIAWLQNFATDASILRASVINDVVGMSMADFAVIEGRVQALREQLQSSRKAVQQESLDEGEIELF
ncbi:MAG: hypothetical protein U0132_08200 [Gemmatimonadaceae bacterium]